MGGFFSGTGFVPGKSQHEDLISLADGPLATRCTRHQAVLRVCAGARPGKWAPPTPTLLAPPPLTHHRHHYDHCLPVQPPPPSWCRLSRACAHTHTHACRQTDSEELNQHSCSSSAFIVLLSSLKRLHSIFNQAPFARLCSTFSRFAPSLLAVLSEPFSPVVRCYTLIISLQLFFFFFS